MTTVQHCIPTFASECLSRGLISEDEEALTHTNNSNAEKAGYLVACVRDSIRNESANFDEFVEVLKSIKYLEGALNKLLERHSKWSYC